MKPRRATRPHGRVCLLQGRQTPADCRLVGGVCRSRGHLHVSLEKARAMKTDGLAAWVGNCIKLVSHRRWCRRWSAGMIVLQLVD